MVNVPKEIMSDYVKLLGMRAVPQGQVEFYQKWLRYYYDFSAKYLQEEDNAAKVRLFLDKLKGKGQSSVQCQQAAHAVTLYFELQEQYAQTGPVKEEKKRVEIADSTFEPAISPMVAVEQLRPMYSGGQLRSSQYVEAGYVEKSDSPEWDEVIGKLADEIKVRHYSRKTLKTYALWSRQFQRFLKNKPPTELTTVDVKEYLTYLAVKCHVAASTQNQAFNSLLFLFRHALKRDFGELRDVPRAKKSLYVPVVLSRPEIDAILAHLA